MLVLKVAHLLPFLAKYIYKKINDWGMIMPPLSCICFSRKAVFCLKIRKAVFKNVCLVHN